MISLEIKDKDTVIPYTPGSVILKTCNRTEIYSGSGDIPESVVRHIFRVTTGLESSLIGEKAIQGQVREAYMNVQKSKISSSMHKLFQKALFVGKRVRTETGINRGAVSHSQAAVDLLLKLDLNLKDVFITILGAHNMNELIIYHLKRKGAKTVFLGNRTFSKAKDIAEKYSSEAFHLDSLEEMLKKTDILISATTAPHQLIRKDIFPKNRPMTIIDLAVPSDVELEVQKMKCVRYINNSGVEDTVNQNLSLREVEIIKASEIVDIEVDNFISKLKSDKARRSNE